MACQKLRQFRNRVLLHNTFHKSEVLVTKNKKNAPVVTFNGAVMPSSIAALCDFGPFLPQQKHFSFEKQKDVEIHAHRLRCIQRGAPGKESFTSLEKAVRYKNTVYEATLAMVQVQDTGPPVPGTLRVVVVKANSLRNNAAGDPATPMVKVR